MKLSELRDEVELKVRDSGFTSEQIDSYINQAILFVATQVELPWLKVVDVVATVPGQPFIQLGTVSGGFTGMLRRVWDRNRNSLSVKPVLEAFLDEYAYNWEAVGNVESVVLDGKNLWYYRVPAEPQQLTLLYYREPKLLYADNDVPVDFPEHLHRRLFVHGAAKIMFDILEDGVEGQKVNTLSENWHSFSEDSKESGVVKLREWVGKRRNHFISSCWRH